jgi:hypothetical protein
MQSCVFFLRGMRSFHLLILRGGCAVFHVVDQEGNKLYDGQVIDRIEQVKKEVQRSRGSELSRQRKQPPLC